MLPEVISIFILPPSRAALEERLIGRGQDAADVIARRLSLAVEEMSHHADFDYLVVNEVFEEAAVDLRSILRATKLRQEVQRTALAKQLAELLDT